MDRDYGDMFRRIVQIMRTDYIAAGSDRPRIFDKESLQTAPSDNATLYADRLSRATMDGLGCDAAFIRIAEEYLAGFGDYRTRLLIDPGRVHFSPSSSVGFHVRAYQDALYVTAAPADDRLAPGDRIDRIDHLRVSESRGRHHPLLFGSTEEREIWDPLLNITRDFHVIHDGGHEEELNIERSTYRPRQRRNTITFLPIAGNQEATIITVMDLDTGNGLETCIMESLPRIISCSRVIIDMRDCIGDDENSIVPLLPFALSREASLSEYLPERYIANYTAANCKSQIAELAQDRTRASGADISWIDDMTGDLRKRSGSGFTTVYEPFDPRSDSTACRKVAPISMDIPIFLLTDITSRGAAEVFAQICHEEQRAKIIGRPSYGSRGFFGDVIRTFEPGFQILYPTCRYEDTELLRMGWRIGVPVDQHIPWTPEHLTHDMDLESVLNPE